MIDNYGIWKDRVDHGACRKELYGPFAPFVFHWHPNHSTEGYGKANSDRNRQKKSTNGAILFDI